MKVEKIIFKAENDTALRYSCITCNYQSEGLWFNSTGRIVILIAFANKDDNMQILQNRVAKRINSMQLQLGVHQANVYKTTHLFT